MDIVANVWTPPHPIHRAGAVRLAVAWDDLAVGAALVFVAHCMVLSGLTALTASLDWTPQELIVPFILVIGVAQMSYVLPMASLLRLASQILPRRTLTEGLFVGMGATFLVNGLGLCAFVHVGG